MKAFISYSTKDQELANKIADSLTYRKVEVWIDRNRIGTGDKLSKTILDGIGSSDMFVLLLTKNWTESKWAQREYEHIERRIMFDNVRVLPLLFSGGSIPEYLDQQEIRYEQCFKDDDFVNVINSGLKAAGYEIPSIAETSLDRLIKSKIPRYGIRLIPSAKFNAKGCLGSPEREYVFIGDYDEQAGASLRTVKTNLFFGEFIESEPDATLKWTAIRFEIGENYWKTYDLLPGTWKSILRILTHKRRMGIFKSSEENDRVIKKYRDKRRYIYYGDDDYCWRCIRDGLGEDIFLDYLKEKFGVDSACFDGLGFGHNSSRIFLVRNLSLSDLNYKKQNLKHMHDPVYIK